MQIWDTSAELPFVSWNWTSQNHTMVANSSRKLKHSIAEGWSPSLPPFLAVSKLSETLVRQTWKWNAMLSTSRNQTFCCPIFLLRFPLWQNNACVCTLGSDIESIIASHSRVAEPSLPQGIHIQRPKVQRPRATAQVTKGTNRNIVWLMVHPSSSDSDSSANLVFLSWGTCSPWHDCGLSYSSLQEKQRRIQERSCKVPPTGTSYGKAFPKFLIG